ncbi:MAG: hypothetical protein H7X99_01625 [Saprospiraceae bacterium]|nr:hypothetical protein [Saprospiraceae bacterium]
MKSFMERWAAPTPKFFKVIRNVGLVLGAVGTALLTAPVSIPAVLVSISGYLVTAGGVITAVSQLTILNDESPAPQAADDEK